MASLKQLLGLYPNTTKYENHRIKLADEYKRLKELVERDDYKRYVELKTIVESDEFKQQKQELLSLNYKQSPEFAKEKEFSSILKNKEFKSYLKTVDSAELKQYTQTKDSTELKRYFELENLIAEEKFKSVEAYYKKSPKKRYLESELHKTFLDYNNQRKNPSFKAFVKFTKSKKFEILKEVEASGDFDKYKELEAKVQGTEFQEAKSSMKKAEFRDSELGLIESDFKSLKKNKAVKVYIKTINSEAYSNYTKLKDSKELEAFFELEKFIHSDEFKSQKNEILQQKFSDTNEYKQLEEFKSLKNSKTIKQFHKFESSKQLEIFNTINNSDTLKRYEELKEEIESDAFIKQKAYLTMKGKQRWLESDLYKQLNEFNELKTSEPIVFYNKNIGHKKYDWLNNWQISFEENFESDESLNANWIKKYYWGDKLLNDSYSFNGELQYLSEDNVSSEMGTLQIETKKEAATGHVWNHEFGFVPAEFDYTSGIINTGDSFRQKYGYFEAKAKFSKTKDITEAIWMVSDNMVPHLDIVKAGKKVSFGNIWENGTGPEQYEKKLGRNKFTSGFYIFSLEWTPNHIIWRINGMEVARNMIDIPSEAMYLAISSTVYKQLNENTLPSKFEVEWIKVYESKSLSE